MITTYNSARGVTLSQQLYELYKIGSFTYKQYQSLKKANPGKQKKAISSKTSLRGTGKSAAAIPQLKRQVKNIQHQLKNDFAFHTNRRIRSGVVFALENTQSHQTITNGCIRQELELAMNSLRYYDPSTPGTLVTADASVGAYSREITIKNVSSHVCFRNNYQTPLRLKLYECTVKDDTNIGPTSAMDNSITDQFTTGGNNTQWGVFPSDCRQLNELFKVKMVCNRMLQPGQQYDFRRNSGRFTYDPSVADSHASTYQREWKSSPILVNVEGTPAHDTVNLEHGSSHVGLDYIQVVSTKIEYDAGTSLNDISILNELDSFTNSALVSNKPISDNQVFSVL